MAVDWNAIADDPCALVAVLRPILYERMAGTGGNVTETQHVDTRTRFSEGMSIRELAAEVRRLESLCKAVQTGRPTHNAIIAG